MADGRKSIASRYQAASTSYGVGGKSVDTGIVEHVILNEDDENILQSSNSKSNPKLVDVYIGSARVRKSSDFSVNKKQLQFYLPLIPDEGVPLVGETVQLVKVGGSEYYKRIPSVSINLGNARNNAEKKLSEKTSEASSDAGSYSEVSQTSTATSDSEERESKLGEYFTPEGIHKLRLYEGDRIIQSRFGQSIRFSGYNNEDNEFSPTILIRNRENDESRNDLERNDITEEDVNKDGSIIALVSDKYKIPFQPGLIDDGGSTNFETNPLYAELPEEYLGNDQILINSERLIFSAKSQETLFFSKGNYSIISDGDLSMDFGFGGAKLDFGDEVWLTTDKNSANVWVNTGNGQIRLNTDSSGNSPGTGQREPLARGETLVDLLSQLIDAIISQIYQTPAGPTMGTGPGAGGPLNIATFKKIQGQLDKIKSTLNFTE